MGMFIVGLWSRSYLVYDGISLSPNKVISYGISSVCGKVIMGSMYDPLIKQKLFAISSVRAGDANQKIFQARSIGMKVPYPCEGPSFEYKKFSTFLGNRPWSRYSITFPIYLLLVLNFLPMGYFRVRSVVTKIRCRSQNRV